MTGEQFTQRSVVYAGLIDPEHVARPGAKEIKIHIVEVRVDALLEDLYHWLGCDTVEMLEINDNFDVWIDEEGKLKEDQKYFSLPLPGGKRKVIAGKAVILAKVWTPEGDSSYDHLPDDRESYSMHLFGDTPPLALTYEEARELVRQENDEAEQIMRELQQQHPNVFMHHVRFDLPEKEE